MSLDKDMQEILEIFFEECAEGLDVMESGLLGLDIGAANLDVVNDIFRAAHSIKGGAATFGFLEVSDFTHGVETLLDQIRAGERPISEEIVEIQLASVDCLRGMLDSIRSGEAIDAPQAADIQGRIKTILASAVGAPPPNAPSAVSSSRWKVTFKPSRGLFRNGTDPLRIFEELERCGDVEVECDTEELPSLADLDPMECNLTWNAHVVTDRGRAAIEEAFAWVTDDCSVDILDVTSATGKATPETPPSETSGTLGKPTTAATSNKESGSIRVSVDKVDTLLNLVGELVITQSMLKRCGEDYSPDSIGDLQDGLIELERYTRELQESAMQIRMLPINVSFSRFPRLVRDLSTKLGKKVELRFSGEQTELDKNVMEKMSDPLVHLVRNSLDHGIETPEARLAAGKPETGVLHLSASHENGNIVIRVEDDGAGINREKVLALAIERGLVSQDEQLSHAQIDNLIFHAGFSTADAVSDVSGRGVGMDVVRNNIKELSGRLEVASNPGLGSVFSICLPLTLAILDGQLVRIGNDVFIFPLLSIVETVQVSRKQVNDIVGAGHVFRLRDRYIPVSRLRDVFNLDAPDQEKESELLVVVESDGYTMGMFVDDLLEQQQVVIKSLEENYRIVNGISGATILGDGRVALIVDTPSLMQQLVNTNSINLKSGSAAA